MLALGLVPYTWKLNFSLDKNSLSQATLVLQKHLVKQIFANAVKVAISSVVINRGQKISVIKYMYLPMRAGGEIGESFLLVKISNLKAILTRTMQLCLACQVGSQFC